MAKSNNTSLYDKKTHLIGRATLAIGLLLTFLPPIVLWLVYGIVPPAKNLINGIISISTIMLPVSIVEILTFSPMLGNGAMYMSYLTGNITNMKMPSAAIAMDITDVKPSTKEGDIISTLAIAGSVIASEIVIVIGVILITPISVKLQNPVLQPAFQQILPALFGSIGAYYILKEWKLAVAPLIVAVILSLIPGLPTAITVPVCVLISILSAKYLYKKGLIKSKE
jgi:hypothetical protein